MASMDGVEGVATDSVPLRIVNEMDNFPYLKDGLDEYKEFMRHYYRLYVKGVQGPLGFVHGSIIVEMPWHDYWTYSSGDNSLVFSGGDDVAERSKLLSNTLAHGRFKAWKAKEPDQPLDPLRYLHPDKVPIFSIDGQHVMDINLSADEMFGVPAYSASLTAWATINGRRYYWIPQMDSNHSMDASKFDNTVTGRLNPGLDHFEHMQNLAEAQALLSKEITKNALKYCETVSYMTHKHKGSFIHSIQPHVQYVYEIELDPDHQPGHSAECQNMRMCDYETVWGYLATGQFKSHAQMTLLAHFIRHRYINADNEPKLQETKTRLHRRVEFPEIERVD